MKSCQLCMQFDFYCICVTNCLITSTFGSIPLYGLLNQYVYQDNIIMAGIMVMMFDVFMICSVDPTFIISADTIHVFIYILY